MSSRSAFEICNWNLISDVWLGINFSFADPGTISLPFLYHFMVFGGLFVSTSKIAVFFRGTVWSLSPLVKASNSPAGMTVNIAAEFTSPAPLLKIT